MVYLTAAKILVTLAIYSVSSPSVTFIAHFIPPIPLQSTPVLKEDGPAFYNRGDIFHIVSIT